MYLYLVSWAIHFQLRLQHRYLYLYLSLCMYLHLYLYLSHLVGQNSSHGEGGLQHWLLLLMGRVVSHLEAFASFLRNLQIFVFVISFYLLQATTQCNISHRTYKRHFSVHMASIVEFIVLKGAVFWISLCWFFIAIEILERVANAQLAREWFREEGKCLLTAQNGLLSTPRGGRCLLRALNNPCFDTKPPTHSAKMGFSEVEQKQKSQPDAFSTCCFKMQAACSCSSSKNAALDFLCWTAAQM